MRNIVGKLPSGVQGEMKGQIYCVFRAETYQQGLPCGRKLVADYRDRYPNAMAFLVKSLGECITCLRLLPQGQRRHAWVRGWLGQGSGRRFVRAGSDGRADS